VKVIVLGVFLWLQW